MAAVIVRLIDENEDVEQMIFNDLASVIPGVASFYIKRVQTTEEFVIGIKHDQEYRHLHEARQERIKIIKGSRKAGQ